MVDPARWGELQNLETRENVRSLDSSPGVASESAACRTGVVLGVRDGVERLTGSGASGQWDG